MGAHYGNISEMVLCIHVRNAPGVYGDHSGSLGRSETHFQYPELHRHFQAVLAELHRDELDPRGAGARAGRGDLCPADRADRAGRPEIHPVPALHRQ